MLELCLVEIATAIRQANTANPLILLDEIDKLGQSIHGDRQHHVRGVRFRTKF